MAAQTSDRIYYFTLAAAILALLAALQIGLMPALLAGLLVYQLVEFGANALARYGVRRVSGRVVLALFLAIIVIGAFALGITTITTQFTDGQESFVAMLRSMADAVDTAKNHLPAWAQTYLPASFEEWRVLASQWLRENARQLGSLGQEAGHSLAHLLFGMIIGGLVAISPGFEKINGPLAREIRDRVACLSDAFQRIVFSQVRISALNTFLTAVFLTVVLPLTGNIMPFTKILIALTFIVGLLPIVGNLVSNTVIFLLGLSVSPWVALGSLIYLVAIHKLEYFMNAHIIGSKIRARAWELLLAMLVMESVFGLAGLVAAPVYYAYIKDELRAKKLI